ncbi:hypothetical protein B0H16DRAFT_1888165, partial [Mycena metata]
LNKAVRASSSRPTQLGLKGLLWSHAYSFYALFANSPFQQLSRNCEEDIHHAQLSRILPLPSNEIQRRRVARASAFRTANNGGVLLPTNTAYVPPQHLALSARAALRVLCDPTADNAICTRTRERVPVAAPGGRGRLGAAAVCEGGRGRRGVCAAPRPASARVRCGVRAAPWPAPARTYFCASSTRKTSTAASGPRPRRNPPRCAAHGLDP